MPFEAVQCRPRRFDVVFGMSKLTLTLVIGPRKTLHNTTIIMIPSDVSGACCTLTESQRSVHSSAVLWLADRANCHHAIADARAM